MRQPLQLIEKAAVSLSLALYFARHRDTRDGGQCGDRRCTNPGAPDHGCYAERPSGAVATTGSATSHATDGPSFSLATAIRTLSGNSTPFFTAVTSARIDTAISGGVRLPM